MKKIVLNEDNLKDEEVQKYEIKTRAVLVNNSEAIIVANYGGVILLPGGKIDDGEDEYTALIRELKEETGMTYDINELKYLFQLEYYQKNYPTREGNMINRKIDTYFFTSEYKGFDANHMILTSKEQKDKFKLTLTNLEYLKYKLIESSNNPRSPFFKNEMIEVIGELEKQKIKVK